LALVTKEQQPTSHQTVLVKMLTLLTGKRLLNLLCLMKLVCGLLLSRGIFFTLYTNVGIFGNCRIRYLKSIQMETYNNRVIKTETNGLAHYEVKFEVSIIFLNRLLSVVIIRFVWHLLKQVLWLELLVNRSHSKGTSSVWLAEITLLFWSWW
jgi:hypothetical protein